MSTSHAELTGRLDPGLRVRNDKLELDYSPWGLKRERSLLFGTLHCLIRVIAAISEPPPDRSSLRALEIIDLFRSSPYSRKHPPSNTMAEIPPEQVDAQFGSKPRLFNHARAGSSKEAQAGNEGTSKPLPKGVVLDKDGKP